MQNANLNTLPDYAFLRLQQVLAIIPVSRSAWYLGVASGKYPAPIKLGERTAVYKLTDIKKLLADIGEI
jgi:predicted DNA-binding transcriptional regulator AlpA